MAKTKLTHCYFIDFLPHIAFFRYTSVLLVFCLYIFVSEFLFLWIFINVEGFLSTFVFILKERKKWHGGQWVGGAWGGTGKGVDESMIRTHFT